MQQGLVRIVVDGGQLWMEGGGGGIVDFKSHPSDHVKSSKLIGVAITNVNLIS